MPRKLADLELATTLPAEDELIVPVFLDKSSQVLKKIRISNLAAIIQKQVLQHDEITMIVLPTGLKFIRDKQA